MSLRSQRFDVLEREWARQDHLDRDQRALDFCEALAAATDASLILVNGEWGAGKTFFLDRCAEILRSVHDPKPHLVEFNAWRQSHFKDPLLDLTHCLTARLDETRSRSLREVAAAVARNMAINVNDEVARRTLGLLDLNHLRQESENRWEDAENELQAFRQRLSEEASRRQIILLIDEVDRCVPSHALQIIETARHVFCVEGVQLVIAVNQDSLEHSIRDTYRSSYDAERYLRRFIDTTYQLPDPPANVVAGYINERLSETGRLPSELFDSSCQASKLLSLAILSPARSIRDVDIAVRLMQQVLADIRAQHEHLVVRGSTLELTQTIDFATMVVVLRLAAPDSYRLLVQAPTDGMGAWRALQQKLGYHFDHGHTELKTSEYLHAFVTYLIALGGTSAVGDVPSIRREDVMPIFAERGIDSLVRQIVSLRRTQLSGDETLQTPMSLEMPIQDWARIIDQEMPALSGPIDA